MKPNVSVKIGALRLKNPVMVASGTFGYAEEFEDLVDLGGLGAIVTKTITLNPRQGNPAPRTCETAAGMLNSIGLENPGVGIFLAEKLTFLKKIGVPVIVSIASETGPNEFILLARRLDKIKAVQAIELNISCPNIKSKGENPRGLIAQNPQATFDLVAAVRKATQKTLIAKLSPNVTDITEVAQAAEEAGSDAVSLVNTFAAMAIDVETRQPKLGTVTGGLSGPAIRPIAVRMVWEVYQKIKIPIIGMGGIMDTQSALEFFISGATAVSVGTANFVQPAVCQEIILGLKRYLKENKIPSINKLIGALNVRDTR